MTCRPADLQNGTEQWEGDAIFHAYWSEQVVADFRRPALLKLLNELGKRSKAVGVLHLGAIKKAVEQDVYGGDFLAFQAAVE